MKNWTADVEKELTQIIKDWLKQQGKTQADLKSSLNSESSRMPLIIDVLKKEYLLGGLPKLAARLCQIEMDWKLKDKNKESKVNAQDSFGQLDLVLQEILEDYD
tara:strand:- start:7 stop:318 length:312 start_codon:yes stop_codon:yes gene_type:complete